MLTGVLCFLEKRNMVQQPAGTGALGVLEGPRDAPPDQWHCVGLGAPSPHREGNGAGATALPVPGGAYVISDITVQEQGDLMTVSPVAVLPTIAGPGLGQRNYYLHPSQHPSMGAAPSWLWASSPPAGNYLNNSRKQFQLVLLKIFYFVTCRISDCGFTSPPLSHISLEIPQQPSCVHTAPHWCSQCPGHSTRHCCPSLLG